ncbi:Protein of unknown function [Bacteroides luti]|uniref:DUF2992 family protein n=1 Tax=Bacteroides luti TaxID=1297750 RepID=A0A1M5D3D7_9BACE|nr:YjdF family protein [Bacteroides luti]SHF61387.1 Protein of unknown function [Bacteroides luti]
MFTHSVTITFCPPLWIALFEIYDSGQYSVAREIIGSSEPTGSDTKLFFERLDYNRLRYTKNLEESANTENKKISYKKLQKKVKRETENINFKYAFTKAQVELKKQQEEKKANSKRQLKEIRIALEEKKFEIKQIKRKDKHRGH